MLLDLDEVFATIKPFSRRPKPKVLKELRNFVETLSLRNGKLFRINKSVPWIFGDVDNPIWLGERSHFGDFVITTEPNQWFIYMDHVLLNWVDSLDKRKYWLAFLKCVVNDRVAYMPIPHNVIGTKAEEEFRGLFCEV